MDGQRFDILARALGGASTRRGALRLAFGGLLGSIGAAVAAEGTLAAGKNGKNGKDAKASGKNGARSSRAHDQAGAARGAGKGKAKGKGKGKRGPETLAAGQFQALSCSAVADCEAAQPTLCYPGGDTSLASRCVCEGNRCKVAICHATASESHPYTNPTVSFNAAGQLQGHAGHADDLVPEPEGGCPEPCPSSVVCAGTCCARGEHCSDGRCCPSGTEWNGSACIAVQCVRDGDCRVDSPCLRPVCTAGVCGSAPRAQGVACGTDCLPATCDGAGGCVSAIPPANGSSCGSGQDAGVCCSGTCAAGACCPGDDATCPTGQTCGDAGTCGCAAICPTGQTQASDCTCSCPSACPAGQTHASDCSCGCPSACPAGQTQASDCSCSCPSACPAGQTQAADCTCTCPDGLTACGALCIDTANDPDNCGGCGTLCPVGQVCDRGSCTETCVPDCTGKTCGSDGCGGFCGECSAGTTCVAGACSATCTPDCAGRTCGDDGCGGSCGTCPAGATCTAAGTCTTIPTPPTPCIPFCLAGSCGSDGCGGSCACPGTQVCDTTSFTCAATCTPACAGRTCGTDGCGGSCGTCADGQFCDETIGVCEANPAICAPTGGNCTVVECCDAADTCLSLDGVLTCQPTPPAPDRCAHAGDRLTEGQRCCDRLHREGGICVINRWDHCDPRKRGKGSFCENGTRCIGGRLSPHGTPVCVPSKKRRGRGSERGEALDAATTPAASM